MVEDGIGWNTQQASDRIRVLDVDRINGDTVGLFVPDRRQHAFAVVHRPVAAVFGG